MSKAWAWDKWRCCWRGCMAAVRSLGASIAGELGKRLGRMTLLRIALVVVIAWLALPIVWNNQPVIDVVNVPKALQDEGYSPEVTERRIKDEINQIEDAAETIARKRGVSLPADSDMPDLELPEANVSLQTVVRFVQHVLHIGPRHIVVDITMVSLDADGYPNARKVPPSIEGSKNSSQDELEVAVYCAEDESDPPMPDRVQSKDLEKALPAIAQDVLSEADPYILAVYVDDHGNHDQAVTLYERAIELDPKDAYSYNGWGWALSEQGKYADAIAKYRKAIELDPKYVLPYNNWGNALAEQGKHDEAIAKYRKAIELDPENAYPYAGWGDALRGQGKYTDAIAKYQKAIELDPENAYPYAGWGDVLRGQGRYADAIAEYQKANELDPKDAGTYNGWGDALDDMGMHDEAIAKFEKAIELDPRLADPYNGLATVLHEEGKYDEAIAQYKKVIELDPKSITAYQNWAIALDEKGKHDEANAKRAIAAKIRAEAQSSTSH